MFAGLPAFLLDLELAVLRDSRPAGFRGTLAIGLAQWPRPVWWIVSSDARIETRFSAVRPAVADCVVLIDGEGGAVLEAQGDASLFERFAARFGPRKTVRHRLDPSPRFSSPT